jgi:hypothetical protein
VEKQLAKSFNSKYLNIRITIDGKLLYFLKIFAIAERLNIVYRCLWLEFREVELTEKVSCSLNRNKQAQLINVWFSNVVPINSKETLDPILLVKAVKT